MEFVPGTMMQEGYEQPFAESQPFTESQMAYQHPAGDFQGPGFEYGGGYGGYEGFDGYGYADQGWQGGATWPGGGSSFDDSGPFAGDDLAYGGMMGGGMDSSGCGHRSGMMHTLRPTMMDFDSDQEEREHEGGGEKSASLLEGELPDPGLGRASLARRKLQESKGKGGFKGERSEKGSFRFPVQGKGSQLTPVMPFEEHFPTIGDDLAKPSRIFDDSNGKGSKGKGNKGGKDKKGNGKDDFFASMQHPGFMQTGGKDAGGKDTGGKDAGGKGVSGKDAGGKDAGGKGVSGKDAGGKGAQAMPGIDGVMQSQGLGPPPQECVWAYIDPHDKIQAGFSSSSMRNWFRSGWLERSLRIALVLRGEVPDRDNFYKMEKWFPEAASTFLIAPVMPQDVLQPKPTNP
eukprot:TRINITY_DN7751_c0_g1_i1.p1 TRINITY_DN7751_c0_g1~~TRINITY_DN7751_c0_g1_i1.p1  ORF type:complete len:433 (-),score=100.90 TRINITY_DN7751_c0_g1_i1:1-1203(-)